MDKLVDRFLRYVRIDTQSDENSETCPSTEKQWDLAKLLEEELRTIGMSDVSIDENGYVMATLPSNNNSKTPIIGFVAHVDTSPEMSGTKVNPRIVEKYDGKPIKLNAQNNVILDPADFPELNKYIGQDLIVTDGTTLLGADDKAGVAEIMTAMEYLLQHSEIKHGTVKVCFPPDEEIGRGANLFDVKKFGADFAYTMDGGEIGELEYENFNAASAKIKIQGRNVHPGTAKDQMVHSAMIGMELHQMLPEQAKPQFTDGYDGFFHLIHFDGQVENSAMTYIIRDHDMEKFKHKKALLQSIVDFLNNKYGNKRIELEMTDQYYNMKEKVIPVFHTIETAKAAIEACGVKPIIKPIRGGTDGARLSFMGLPCPNIFAGGHNFHGKYEYVPIPSMEKSVEVIVKIVEMYGGSNG